MNGIVPKRCLMIGRVASMVLVFLVVFATVISICVGYWVYSRFGYIPAWMIVANMFESPAVLPTRDLVLLTLFLLASVSAAVLTAASYRIVIGRLRYVSGVRAAVAFAIVFVSALLYGLTGAFDLLDGWFAIRHEIACRWVKSEYFAANFHRVHPADVEFEGRRRNLVVIVSESLEEGFAEGAVGGENLLPGLTAWRGSRFHADMQCQSEGSSFTSAALTSLFYGIPRIRLDGAMLLQNTGMYPQFSIDSIWDVFLGNGYLCAYVQGGNFEFGSKGRLFPENSNFRRIGFDEMCKDPDYLAEPVKHDFGVNDEVMFRHLKDETIRLEESGHPFVLVGLTLNTHCPDGWCSALVPKGSRGTLAESIIAQDRMICDFLRWMEARESAQNTVIVVVGDHWYWGRGFSGASQRRVFNAVHVPDAGASPFKRTRRFATFDWAPTFIELAGGRLPGDGHFGLGVSLLRDTRTLFEDIDESRFDDEMRYSLSDYWDIVLKKR